MPFEVLIPIYRSSRFQLHLATFEALVVGWTQQLSIQAWRGNLQQIRVAGNHILDIEDSANLSAYVRAILVGHANRFVVAARARSGKLVDHDAEHARLA